MPEAECRSSHNLVAARQSPFLGHWRSLRTRLQDALRSPNCPKTASCGRYRPALGALRFDGRKIRLGESANSEIGEGLAVQKDRGSEKVMIRQSCRVFATCMAYQTAKEDT